MRCLVCEQVIDPVDPDRADVAFDAVVIEIRGNYGSGVYNPPASERRTNHLRAYLCDTCLERKGLNGLIDMVQTLNVPKIRTATWSPGKFFWGPEPAPEPEGH